MPMVRAADEHEMRGRAANFGASHHQGEVPLLGMCPSHLETVMHRHREARFVASEAGMNATLQVALGQVDHSHRPFLRYVGVVGPNLKGGVSFHTLERL